MSRRAYHHRVVIVQDQEQIRGRYAQGDKTQTTGIAEYRLVESLPTELQTSLPSIEEIEQALASEAGRGDA